MVDAMENEKSCEKFELAGGCAVLWRGDCLDVLRGMPDNSVDSIVTDPPYGLSAHSTEAVADCLREWVSGEQYVPRAKGGFMSKTWDAWVPGPEVWREVIRVLKPGGHALIFAGTRSLDLMGIALRLAGFELRDTIGHAHDGGGAPLMGWCFGSGFPKGHDIQKALDAMAGAEREVIGRSKTCIGPSMSKTRVSQIVEEGRDWTIANVVTAPSTDLAKRYAGFNTSLKPAFEPILLCRKPLAEATIAANVVKHGTGALNIGACRVPTAAWDATAMERVNSPGSGRNYGHTARQTEDGRWDGPIGTGAMDTAQGRWPANIVLDDSAEVRACFPETKSGVPGIRQRPHATNAMSGQLGMTGRREVGVGDAGSAARFFRQCTDDDPEDAATRLIYVPKASRADRNEGCDGLGGQPEAHNLSSNACGRCGLRVKMNGSGKKCECGELRETVKLPTRGNGHPTVKPTVLMRYLVRLVTPPGGLVLDPFCGSGSTGKAAMLEGFRFVGVEMESEYVEIAKARIEHAARTAAEEQEKEVAAQQRQTELFG